MITKKEEAIILLKKIKKEEGGTSAFYLGALIMANKICGITKVK